MFFTLILFVYSNHKTSGIIKAQANIFVGDKLKARYRILLIILGAVISIEFVLLLKNLLAGKTVAVLSPAGSIASQQKDIMVFTVLVCSVVLIAVYTLTLFITWRYRDGNTKAKYRPNWSENKVLETIWWGIPIIIIIILGTLAWKSSHALDPYKPIESSNQPIRVQVIALNWKWLFLYPDQGIATVNYLQVPEKTPINFEITSDGPMNSFWIPQLGGQVYAMAGMETKLHLIADRQGSFSGLSANISGKGFSGMKFNTIATSHDDFNKWVADTKSNHQVLSEANFNQLVKPSENNPPFAYSAYDQTIYDNLIGKYMKHPSNDNSGAGHVPR
jgi:cytochrome o ubiquinol oxidase subunit 2